MSPVAINGVEQVIAHKTSHQDTGADEISVAALSGELADRQPSKVGTSVLGWTDEKLLKGAGAGVAPDEIDVPAGGVTTFAALTDVKVIRKTADQTVNNSIALVNDTHLLFAIAANEVWAFDVYLYYVSAQDADFRLNFVMPSGSAHMNMSFRDTVDTYVTISFANNSSKDVGATASWDLLVIHGLLTNGATAGDLQLQWCQTTAKVSDTKVFKDSCIIAHKIA